jgi:glycosyltransferase involved in cell wall biosynthesis
MSRIAIIGPAYPYRGGPPLVVANLYELLSRRHNVEVFSFTRLYPRLLFPGKRQEDISKHPAKQHPVRRRIDSINPWTWYKTAREIIAFKPDLVLVDWYQPFFGACYRVICSMLRKHGIPTVFLCENVISHESRFIDTFLSKLALSQSDSFIVFSDSVAKTLQSMYPGRDIERATLPLFFSESSAPKTWSSMEAKSSLGLEGDRVLLFFGYIRKYKGLRNLIKAFPMVARQHPDAFLLIVGECYEDAVEYNDLIEKSGFSNRIRWINEYVANEDVGLYYAAAELVVLPYVSATQSGIVKIAFGFSKPVLATNVGGLSEEIERFGSGRIVASPEPEILAEGINFMLAEPSLAPYADGATKARQANSFDEIGEMIERCIRA